VKETIAALLIIVLSLAAFIAWLHYSFSSQVALVAVTLIGVVVIIVVGITLAATIQRNTLNGVAQFMAKDATVDRYRMQSQNEILKLERERVKADNYRVKTDEQLRLEDERRKRKQLEVKPQEDYQDPEFKFLDTEIEVEYYE
jgi:hypothetical protein